MESANGTFEITSMGEDTYQTLEDGAKLTRANGSQRFEGDIEGEGSVEWLMSYGPDGGARFLGIQRIVAESAAGAASAGNRAPVVDTPGFLIEAVGNFDGSSSKGSWAVIEGSGTDGFAGLRGEGGFEAASGTKASYSLEYELT